MPPQKYSPCEPMFLVRAWSTVIAKPRPKPRPSNTASLNSDLDSSVSSLPPGRWFMVISFSVLGLTIRAPSSSPPFSSMRQNRM